MHGCQVASNAVKSQLISKSVKERTSEMKINVAIN